MAIADRFDCLLTIQSEDAAIAWGETARAFLSHGNGVPDHLAAALELDPHFAMGHAARGLFCLLLARRELVPVAESALLAAKAAQSRTGTTAREAAYLDALSDWLAGRPSSAADRLDAVLASHPSDALTLKLIHQIRFMLGDNAGMRRSVEGAIEAYQADHPLAGYAHGCHAFALEETGEFAAAEAAGRRALDLAPDDAWGLHAVAHVHDMAGRSRDGLAWLGNREAAFAHCNNFRYHVWWHKALFHLDLGEIEAVLALYDQSVRAEHSDDFRDIANGASLLSRLELEGIDVGRRWEELAEICERRVEDGCLVFADLHYLLALCGGARSDSAGRLVNRMRADADGAGEMSRVAANSGVQIASALTAFRAGDYASASRWFAAGQPKIGSIGGSHAQRDVFERLAIEAAIRGGLLEDARTLLSDRARRRGAMDGFAHTRLARIEGLMADNDIGDNRLQVAL